MITAASPTTDTLTVFGWLALFDGLRVINEKDPERRLREINTDALTRYIGRRRDVLLDHHQPAWRAAQ